MKTRAGDPPPVTGIQPLPALRPVAPVWDDPPAPPPPPPVPDQPAELPGPPAWGAYPAALPYDQPRRREPRPRTTAGRLAPGRRLIAFGGLFFTGVVLGTLVFALSGAALRQDLSTMLEVRHAPEGFAGAVSAVFASCFSTVLLLSLQFLGGLSVCGVPLAAAIPFFFGLGIGMTEAYYYAMGASGILVAALLVAPHGLIAAAALVMGGMESARMSLLFSRQLLPRGGRGEPATVSADTDRAPGLWDDFKLYIARFIILLGVALAAGTVDVCLRLLAQW